MTIQTNKQIINTDLSASTIDREIQSRRGSNNLLLVYKHPRIRTCVYNVQLTVTEDSSTATMLFSTMEKYDDYRQ